MVQFRAWGSVYCQDSSLLHKLSQNSGDFEAGLFFPLRPPLLPPPPLPRDRGFVTHVSLHPQPAPLEVFLPYLSWLEAECCLAS